MHEGDVTHSRSRLSRLRLRATLAAALCVGCESPVGVESRGQSSMVLVVPIDARVFASNATLVAQIWNAEQLAALANNAGCTANRNAATGVTEMSCPPGVTYQEVTPQRAEFPGGSSSGRLEITPAGVRAGEQFRIRVSGPSADGCNTTSGDRTLTAGSDGAVAVTLAWETTAKACG
jgi:hypothetical protein